MVFFIRFAEVLVYLPMLSPFHIGSPCGERESFQTRNLGSYKECFFCHLVNPCIVGQRCVLSYLIPTGIKNDTSCLGFWIEKKQGSALHQAGAHFLFLLGRNGLDGEASPDPLLLAPDPISFITWNT